MLRLEDFMEIQKLHHDGWSVTEIARQLDIDRKTVRKYLKQAPREYERQAKSWRIDPWRAYLRERWEQGVHNASRLFLEIRKRGYDGCLTQVKKIGLCARMWEKRRFSGILRFCESGYTRFHEGERLDEGARLAWIQGVPGRDR